MPCGHLLGKGWPLGYRLWCLIVNGSISHWYPGSGVVFLIFALFLTLVKITWATWPYSTFKWTVLLSKCSRISLSPKLNPSNPVNPHDTLQTDDKETTDPEVDQNSGKINTKPFTPKNIKHQAYWIKSGNHQLLLKIPKKLQLAQNYTSFLSLSRSSQTFIVCPRTQKHLCDTQLEIYSLKLVWPVQLSIQRQDFQSLGNSKCNRIIST